MGGEATAAASPPTKKKAGKPGTAYRVWRDALNARVATAEAAALAAAADAAAARAAEQAARDQVVRAEGETEDCRYRYRLLKRQLCPGCRFRCL